MHTKQASSEKTKQHPGLQCRTGLRLPLGRLFCCLLLLCCLLSGCGIRSLQPVTDGRLRVVCTLFPQYDFVRAIAGELVDLRLLLPPGVDSHRFEPTPADIIGLQRCDLLIRVDEMMELWLPKLLGALEQPPDMLTLSQAIGVKVEAEHDHEGEEEKDHAQENTETSTHLEDPHLWTNPRYARKMAESIAQTLSQKNPANAAAYAENAARLMQELDQLDQGFRAVVKNGKRDIVVFGSSFALRNFTEEYGLRYMAAFDSCGEHAEPAVRVVADMTKILRGKGIPVVFKQELTSARVSENLAAETGARVLEFHTCHNVTRADFRAGVTYLSLMRRNLEALRQALV